MCLNCLWIQIKHAVGYLPAALLVLLPPSPPFSGPREADRCGRHHPGSLALLLVELAKGRRSQVAGGQRSEIGYLFPFSTHSPWSLWVGSVPLLRAKVSISPAIPLQALCPSLKFRVRHAFQVSLAQGPCTISRCFSTWWPHIYTEVLN